MAGWARACSNCAMWVDGPKIRGARLGYCTHPRIGRVVRDDDSCLFYVRADGRGFDENAALRAFERVQAGRAPSRPVGPAPVDLDALRDRNRRDNAWDPRRRGKR